MMSQPRPALPTVPIPPCRRRLVPPGGPTSSIHGEPPAELPVQSGLQKEDVIKKSTFHSLAVRAAFESQLPSLRLMCGEDGAGVPIHDPTIEMVQMITRSILTVDERLTVTTPLGAAVRAKQEDVARALLAMAGRQELVLEGKLLFGGKILHWAAAEGLVKLVTVLVEHGMAITAVDASGNNVLCWATRHAQVDVVRYLLNRSRAQGLSAGEVFDAARPEFPTCV